MYYLSVGAVFKNESIILREWIEHYLFHGVEHFFLIDDSSTDDFLTILQPYIDKNIVTLFQHKQPWDYYLGRQKDMYNHFIYPHIHETKWLAMLDIDEYLWSPMNMDIRESLKHCEHLGQIQVQSIYFGSNGFENQPISIVQSFTKRSTKTDGGIKYLINTAFAFKELTIHHAYFMDTNNEKDYFKIIGEPYFRINHYSCQSREFWNNIKCTRGDGDNWRKRVPEDFDLIDLNEIEDNGLYEQNKTLFV